MTLRCLSALALLALGGCDAQVDPTYQGEPLATVQGSVASQSALPAGEAVLVWANPNTSPDTILGVTAAVSSTFPASFAIPLYAPPPDTALVSYVAPGAVPRVAIGIVTMMKAGADLGDSDKLEAAMLGYCETHVVAYVKDAIAAGDRWEQMLGGRPSVGYHLMDIVRRTQAEKDAVDACIQQREEDINACHDVCSAISEDDDAQACHDACDAPGPSCGNTRDTFREAAGGFATTITVTTSPTRDFDWY